NPYRPLARSGPASLERLGFAWRLSHDRLLAIWGATRSDAGNPRLCPETGGSLPRRRLLVPVQASVYRRTPTGSRPCFFSWTFGGRPLPGQQRQPVPSPEGLRGKRHGNGPPWLAARLTGRVSAVDGRVEIYFTQDPFTTVLSAKVDPEGARKLAKGLMSEADH